MKRIRLFLLLSLLSMAMTTFAVTFTDDQGRTWNFTPVTSGISSASLTAFSGTDLVIPKTITYNGTTYNNVSFTISDSFRGTTKLKTLKIENGVSTYQHKPSWASFTIPANAFQNCTALTSIDFGNNSLQISNYAFDGCTALTTVTNQLGVAWIGDFAFRNCKNWRNESYANFGNGLFHVGAYAFQNCKKLLLFRVPFSIDATNTSYFGEGAFAGSGIMLLYIPRDMESIPKKLCYDCDSLQFVGFLKWDLHNDDTSADDEEFTFALRSIGDSAFANCGKLKHLMTAKTYVHVLDGSGTSSLAYSGHNADSTMCLLPSLNFIGNYAFANCTNFYGGRHPIFPSQILTIGDYAFYKNVNMYAPDFSGATGLMSIGKHCFEYDEWFWGINLSKTKLTTIPDYAFAHCPSLWLSSEGIWNGTQDGKFNGYITSIGERAFFGDTNIKMIYLDKTTTSIGDYAFYGCTALHTVDIPSGNKLTTIGNSCFDSDAKLKTISFPASSPLTTIGSSAFSGCELLTDNFKSLANTQLKTVGTNAFYNCKKLTYVDFPSTIQSIGGGNVFGNDLELIGISIPTGNSYYTSSYGYPLLTKDGKTLLCYPAKHTTLTNYNPMTADFVDGYLVPSTVTKLDDYAFQGCQDLHIVLPKALTTIGSYAFDQCTQMTELTIPENVTSFGFGALSNCNNLTALYMLPTTPPSIITSAAGGFSNTTKENTNLYVKTSVKDTYAGTFGWGGTYKLFKAEPTNLIPYTPTQKYQSRCFDFDADFNFTSSSLQVYTITGYNQTANKLDTAIIKYVPSRISGGNNQGSYTGVIIKATPNTAYTFRIGENSNPASVGTNFLRGCPGTHWVYGKTGYTAVPPSYYGLNGNKMRRYTKAGRVPYNRAYLDDSAGLMGIPTNLAEIQIVSFDDDDSDVTGIDSVDYEQSTNGKSGWYTLDGVKLNVKPTQKGLYIKDGKKVVIK